MAATGPQVLVKKDPKAYEPVFVAAPKTAWQYLGWLGGLLAVIGGVDIALRWYPTAFRSPEWEFGTIGITVGTLPLFTIGLVLVFAASLARASSFGIRVMSGVFSLLAVLLAAALVLFLLDVPIALRVTDPAASLEIRKTIARTLVMGAAFELMFVGSAFVSLRFIFRRLKDV